MSIFDNKNFTAKALVELVQGEGNRIVKSNLATDQQFRDLMTPILKGTLEKSASCDDGTGMLIGMLSGIHKRLLAIKLPGDFEKYATGEEFFIALDLPLDEPKIKIVDEEDCVACQAEEEECEGDDCDDPSDISPQNMYAEAVNEYLAKVAHVVGAQGNHGAARLIERTMQVITRKANKNQLF